MNNDIKEKPTPDNTIEIDVNKLKTSNIKLNKIFKEKDDWFIEYYDIKEILSKMERLIVYGQYNAYYDLEKQLLDYITNLQEELKEYEMIFDTFSKRPYAHRYLEEKKKELGNNKIIGLDSEMIYKDYYDLKLRKDKAIEHIKQHQLIFENQYEELSGFDNHLLDILNGDDE